MTLAQHADRPGPATPRMPCKGLKAFFCVDPFAKAGEIRRGELDDQLPSFEEITGWLQRVPVTWLPALLSQCITSCLAGNVFQDGKLIMFVAQCEKNFNEPGNGVLR